MSETHTLLSQKYRVACIVLGRGKVALPFPSLDLFTGQIIKMTWDILTEENRI